MSEQTMGTWRRTRLLVLVMAVGGLMAGMLSLAVPASAATAYTAQKINTPGQAVRMSSAGYLTGSYQVKCSKLGGQPPRTICYYAPWYYNGKGVTKINWPDNWPYVYSIGINDSLTLVGNQYMHPSWAYSGGTVSFAGSLSGGIGGATLSAINDGNVAVGGARNSASVMRTITFQNGTVTEVPAFRSTVANSGADINDAGWIVGNFTAPDGTQQAFVWANGTTIPIPDLPNSTSCQAVALSQQNGWVIGNCSDRGFLFNLSAGTVTELMNSSGTGGGVQVWSVNGQGVAVGVEGAKAVVWNPGNKTAIDLSTLAAGTPLSRATDINDAGAILATYVDPVTYSFTTYLLKPA